jgi:DnaJ-class molecular chaperone
MISKDPGKCLECGKKLKRSKCTMCRGKGKYRKSATQQEEICSTCAGSGVVYICPNLKKHILNAHPEYSVIPDQASDKRRRR